MRVLFIVKRGQNYGWGLYSSSGLFNSAQGCVDALQAAGIYAKLVVVTDNNDIDREVAAYKPDVVIVEALWVVPEKFKILTKLHPGVKWVVRVHSKFAFLAGEGIAMEWLLQYQYTKNVYIAFNDEPTRDSFNHLTHKDTLYLPTCYSILTKEGQPLPPKGIRLDVCSFGAIRPLKNQLTQAVAAIQASDKLSKILNFHINSTRVESRGEEVLKNLRSLFKFNQPHTLVEHPWYSRKDLPGVLATMQLGMQVSLSETFNIMAADMVVAGLPIVVSSEIPWASLVSMAETSDVNNISTAIRRVLGWPRVDTSLNLRGLERYARGAAHQWVRELKELVSGKL